MARGSAVIPYHGKRGTVWRIKYADADGKQVMETVGAERDGWTKAKAERALGVKLAEVERGMRKPSKRTFDDLATEFVEVALAAKPRKKSTVIDYKATIRNHLSPAFGSLDLGALSRSPEAFEKYAATKLAAGRSAKSVRNDLVLLGLMFKTARRWRWVSENPLDLVDPPPLGDADTETLAASDVVAVLKAYRELEARAEGEDADVVRGCSPHDHYRSLDRDAPGRTARSPLAGRGTPRPAAPRSAGVRSERDHDAEVEGGAEGDRPR